MHKSKLHVISVISNPVRFASRYALYKQFQQEMHAQGVTLYTGELAFGDRPFEVTNHSDQKHLRVRSSHEIWHKENLINLTMRLLPQDWEYVAWIDADISFLNPNWALETIHALQHYAIVQPWQTAIDLGPSQEAMQTHQSFGFCVIDGSALSVNWKPYTVYPHTGFAWAASRYTIDALGGLIDKAILGAGDHHMAWSLIGKGKDTLPGGAHPNYIKDVLRWEERAEKYIRRDVGFVPGTIFHHWHGKKKDRKYVDRWKILIENDFDPEADLKRDWQGLYQLTDRSIGLRDGIRKYFRGRNEDSTDIE